MIEADESLNEKRRRQTQEIHAAIGRYVEAFELLVNQIRTMCVILCSHSVKHQRLMNIVFHHRSMTAEPLFNIFRAFIGEMMKENVSRISPQEVKAIEGTLRTFDSDFQNAVKRRNELLHGTWFIDWHGKDSTDFSTFTFSKFKIQKDGLVPVEGPTSAYEIDALTEECKRLEDYFLRLFGCITWHDGPRVSANFVWNDAEKRWLIRPKGD